MNERFRFDLFATGLLKYVFASYFFWINSDNIVGVLVLTYHRLSPIEGLHE